MNTSPPLAMVIIEILKHTAHWVWLALAGITLVGVDATARAPCVSQPPVTGSDRAERVLAVGHQQRRSAPRPRPPG